MNSGIYANNQNNYNQAMEYVNLTLERDTATKADNLLFLKFMIDSIGRDIETDTLLYYVYNANDNAPVGNRVFPHTIYLENGDEIQLFSDRFEKRKIDLATEVVIAQTWRKPSVSKVYDLLGSIDRNGFKYDYRNHRGTFYPYMNITIVSQGHHSISCSHYLKKGTINVNVYDIESAYKYVDTDGCYWLFNNCKNKKVEINNFRYALLFKLSKMYFELLNS